MTAAQHGYGYTDAGPDAYDRDYCTNCGGRLPDYAEALCNRCSELAEIMADVPEVAALVTAARAYLSLHNGWSSDFGRALEAFPEATA